MNMNSVFAKKEEPSTEIEATDNVTPNNVTPITEEVDIVKLASAKKALVKKVADWEDRISDAELEVDAAKEALFGGETGTFDVNIAEDLVKVWRVADNKVNRLNTNLATYRTMLEEATAKLKAAV